MIDIPSQSHFECVLAIDKVDSTEKFKYRPVNSFNPVAVKQKAFELMNQLTGWCAYSKGALIMDLIIKHKPQTIVEIGVWGGKSLVPMAYVLRELGRGKVYGIDPWDKDESLQWVVDESNRKYWGWADHNAILYELLEKIERFELSDQIELIRATSEDAPLIYDIDMLHIDGNHSEETSFIDVTKWVPLVKSGGWIFFDDLHWYENGKYTTAKAVAWLNANCIKIAELTDQADWGIWVKP